MNFKVGDKVQTNPTLLGKIWVNEEMEEIHSKRTVMTIVHYGDTLCICRTDGGISWHYSKGELIPYKNTLDEVEEL